jgi:hypothetical protein
MQINPFGLPQFNQVMDSTVGCSLLSFLDCYSRYHRIPLKVEDQIKISFIIQFSAFCYTFGVPSRKLLGYMISQRGIDPNPAKL